MISELVTAARTPARASSTVGAAWWAAPQLRRRLSDGPAGRRTGDFPACDLRQLDEASIVRDEAHVITGELGDTIAAASRSSYSAKDYR